MTDDIINQLKHIKQHYVYSSYDSVEQAIGNLQYSLDKIIELLIEKEESEEQND